MFTNLSLGAPFLLLEWVAKSYATTRRHQMLRAKFTKFTNVTIVPHFSCLESLVGKKLTGTLLPNGVWWGPEEQLAWPIYQSIDKIKGSEKKLRKT